VKVALVCDWYRPRIGGIELHLESLAQHLTRAGHDVVVITPTPGAAIVDDVRVHRIDTPLAPHFGFLRSAAGVRAIGRALEQEQVDVAHAHVSIVSPAAIGCAIEAERRGIPSVVTFHSVVPRTDLLAHAMRLAFRTNRWRARFTAVSARVAREVQPAAGGHAVAILPNGIDTAFWQPGADRPTQRRDDAFELLSVMRLNAKKRPHALVDIMVRVRALVGATTPIRLRVVGDGPLRRSLARAIARAKLGDSVELLGRRSRDEIRQLLAVTDAFVLPTIRESFGLAALEARCAGVPVVAMAQSGVAEVIAHTQEGLLGRSDAELAAHLATLIRDPLLRTAIASHNASTPTPFDWPRVVEAHEAVYHDAIALRDNARAEIYA
jgi:glycosyltransferase involved in cell wall biosynthesis